MDQIVETWNIHNRINLYLLDAVEPDSLSLQAASKGRTVGEQFSHIHNVRLMWLKSARPDLLAEVKKLETADMTDRALINAALVASGNAIAKLLEESLASDRKVKGFKPHAIAFFGYLISHESHHRGQIALSLKQAGKPFDKKTAYGIWEWGVR